MTTVHQLVPNFDYGDAIGNHVRALRRLLRSWGWTSEVYAQYTHEKLLRDAHFYTKYRAVASPDHVVIFHFSIGSDVTPFFVEPAVPEGGRLPQHHPARVLRGGERPGR